jgi:hypothetical protein
MDLSRKLFSICAISFIISLCLILHTCVQTFDVIGVKKNKENKRGLSKILSDWQLQYSQVGKEKGCTQSVSNYKMFWLFCIHWFYYVSKHSVFSRTRKRATYHYIKKNKRVDLETSYNHTPTHTLYIYVHSKSNVSRKAKTSYNMERRE